MPHPTIIKLTSRHVEGYCEKEGQFCFGPTDSHYGIDMLGVVDVAWFDHTRSIYPAAQCIRDIAECGAIGGVLSVSSKDQQRCIAFDGKRTDARPSIYPKDMTQRRRDGAGPTRENVAGR